MPLSVSGDENAFTKILTTAPNDMQKGKTLIIILWWLLAVSLFQI